MSCKILVGSLLGHVLNFASTRHNGSGACIATEYCVVFFRGNKAPLLCY